MADNQNPPPEGLSEADKARIRAEEEYRAQVQSDLKKTPAQIQLEKAQAEREAKAKAIKEQQEADKAKEVARRAALTADHRKKEDRQNAATGVGCLTVSIAALFLGLWACGIIPYNKKAPVTNSAASAQAESDVDWTPEMQAQWDAREKCVLAVNEKLGGSSPNVDSDIENVRRTEGNNWIWESWAKDFDGTSEVTKLFTCRIVDGTASIEFK